jgi:hypothetical protein
MLKLQTVSGLGNSSPLQDYLKIVDDMLVHHNGWAAVHRNFPVEVLYEGFLTHLGHPVVNPVVEEDAIRNYIKWLEGDEPVLAWVLQGMRERGVAPHGIRITMMFLIANLEYLKEREGEDGRVRTIDDGVVQ